MGPATLLRGASGACPQCHESHNWESALADSHIQRAPNITRKLLLPSPVLDVECCTFDGSTFLTLSPSLDKLHSGAMNLLNDTGKAGTPSRLARPRKQVSFWCSERRVQIADLTDGRHL